jgi:tetratricopeptide (TPR) repeat protein
MPRKPKTQPNLRLIAAREASGLRAAQCARALERHAHTEMPGNWLSFRCSEERYRSWEQGRIPREYVWPVLTSFFNKSLADLGLIGNPSYATGDTGPSVGGRLTPPTVQELPSQRRDFLAGALGIALPTAPTPARVEMSHVHSLVEGSEQLRQRDQARGGVELVPAAERLLGYGRALLGSGAYGDRVSRALHCAVGEVAIIAGWLHFDAGDRGRARALYHDALAASLVGHEPALSVHAMANLGFLAHAEGRSREAVDLARAARDAAGRWADSQLAALLLAREARACASIGDAAGAERAAGQALAAFDSAEPNEGAWYRFFDAGELHGHRGSGLAALGRLDAAEEQLRHALDLAATERPRNALTFRLRLVRVLLSRSDWQAAAEEGYAAVDAAVGMRSARISASLGQLRDALIPHRRQKPIAALDDQLRSALA